MAGSVLRLENAKPAYKLPTGKLRLEHLADSTPTAALRLAAFRQAMSANYMILLDKTVFQRKFLSGKEGLKFRKILSSEEANTILDFIWKESIFISELNVMRAGLQKKKFSGFVRCYSLGVLLASNKNEVAAVVTRVRNIVLAACAYDLVFIDRVNSKSAPVYCKPLLNEMMLELGALNSEAGQQFLEQIGSGFPQLCQQTTAFHTGRS